MWWCPSSRAWWRKAANISFLHTLPVVWLLQPCVSKALLWCLFFLSYCQEGRDQHKNSAEQGVLCRATGAVSMTWDSSEPKTRSKWKCWEIQMYSLFSDNFTPHQPAALQPTLSTQSRRHIPHRQAGSEIATLYREWVLIGEKNSSRELSRDFKGLHFPEAKFNLWLFSSVF